MSEPKLISPMLDNFVMGDPISEHGGVRCCPAMEKDSDNKYIVKIISVPASQTQVDALLLSGACSSQEAALSYFKELAESIVSETEILKKLSALEGFVAITDCQVEQMQDGTGYDVYLLSTYRNTLQRTLRRSNMTHLAALNLGLDLCAALAVCRRSGYLYADLKPGNIYLTGENAYRIGDLGFLKLESLKYTSLPERYRSEYIAPEIADAYSSLNTTIDVYALGLILYQVFNGGQLPFKEDTAPEEQFTAPAYADYEMAEIILKACAPDPADRWQDPVEMGQALVAYMQRNGAHDTPIVPAPTAQESEQSEAPEEAPVVAEETPVAADVTEQPEAEEADDNTCTDDVQPDAQEQLSEEQEQVEAVDETDEQEVTEASIYTEDPDGNLTFIEDILADETLPGQESIDLDYGEVTEEVSDMLAQADELIAHDAPEPVVQPEPIDVPIPPPIMLEEEPEETQAEDASADENEDPENGTETEAVQDDVSDDDNSVEADDEEPAPKRRSHWLRNTLLVLLALALIAGSIFFYKAYYLQTIDSILLDTSEDGVLTVLVTSQVPEDTLTVVCTDTYGNQLFSPVVDGKAVFSQLTANSAYTVKVVVDGFHRLTGDTSAAYTTPSQTEIVQFNAATGSEDGSVILSFTIEGPDSDQWEVSYKTSEDTIQYVAFSGHMVTLSQLPVGAEYTFTLASKSGKHIVGTTEVTHVVSKVVTATDLKVTSIIDNKLTAQWASPADTSVDSWTVRCYNDSFDQTLVTEEPTASFEIPDAAAGYTVEVTAAGMSVSERTYVAENSVSVTDFTIDSTDPNKLTLSWVNVGEVDTQGWSLQYTVNGSAAQELALTEANTCTVAPVIPGCTYTFSLLSADASAVLGSWQSYSAPQAAAFSGYAVSAEYMEFMMCRTPGWSGWDRYDLSSSDYTTEFSVGEDASFLVRLHHEYNTSEDNITTLFVIRDENGAIVSADTQTRTWTDMWYKNYCELDIPALPQAPGNYTVSIYFNGQLANETAFTVVSE